MDSARAARDLARPIMSGVDNPPNMLAEHSSMPPISMLSISDLAEELARRLNVSDQVCKVVLYLERIGIYVFCRGLE
jgi:hypothetical protein